MKSEKPKRICRVEGCEREANTPGSARGLCVSHYRYRKEYDATAAHSGGKGASDAPLPAKHWITPDDAPIADFYRPEGRPPADIDLALLERSAKIGCTQVEMAALLNIGLTTLKDHLRDDPALQEMIDRGREAGKAALRRMQWAGAESGNPTMLIWLGKQWLGQTDKIENSGTVDNRLKVIVEFVGDAAPQQIEHDKPQEPRFTPRLVNDVDWKG